MHKTDFDRGYDDSFSVEPLTQEQCQRMDICYSSYIEGFDCGFNDGEDSDYDDRDDAMDVSQYY